jgi:hypothetical protein
MQLPLAGSEWVFLTPFPASVPAVCQWYPPLETAVHAEHLTPKEEVTFVPRPFGAHGTEGRDTPPRFSS